MVTKAELDVAIAGVKTSMISKDTLERTVTELEEKYMQQVNRLEQQVKCLALELASKNQKIEELEKSVQSKLETMLKASIASVETNSSNVLWSSIAANGRGKSVEEIKVAKAIAAVSKENDRKEKSIVVMGLPVSTQPDAEQQKIDDLKQIENIVGILKVDKEKIKRVYRFRAKTGATNNRPPLVMVEMATPADKMDVLRGSKQLRQRNEYKEVYINPDQDEEERKMTRKLVDERNRKNEALRQAGKFNLPFRYGIRRNAVVEIHDQ
jgi:hypothetical protein